MRTLFPLIGLSLSLSDVGAQTLTGSSNSIVPGDAFVVHEGSGPAPVPSNWNYVDLVPQGAPSTRAFLQPGSSPYSSDFPTATVRSEQVFMRCDATGIYTLGYGDVDGSMIDSDPKRQFAFPCGYMTTWTDTFSGVNGNGSTESGTISGEADAFGSLVLPYGTVTNVLRVHVTEEGAFVIDGSTLNYSSEEYFFFKPGIHYPVLSTDPSGQVASWLDPSSVGVEELLAQEIGIDVFPNPATEAMDVIYGATGEHFTLDLFDASGALIRHHELGAGTGILKQHVDLAGLAKGLYSVRITDGHGGQGTRRVVVQ